MIDQITNRVGRFIRGHSVFLTPVNANGSVNSVNGVNQNTQLESASQTGSQNTFIGFFDKVKFFFKTLFGFSIVDNKPYENLYKELKTYAGSRAQYLFDKSKSVVEHANRQIANGKNPWEDLSEDAGVQMSTKLAQLLGNNAEQRYYYNCAVNWWAGTQLGIHKSDDKVGECISVDDLDNTWRNKNWDPSDPWLVASHEELMWSRKVFQMGEKDKLNVSEWVNTARAPFPTVIQIVPEGLEKSITYGVLHGPFQERYGLSMKDQAEFAKRAVVIALNSSIIHKPNEPTKFSAKLLRETEMFRFLDELKIDGKTFLESYLSMVKNESFSVFEPKGLPKWLLDTHRFLGEAYLPQYQKIIDLKEEIVDKRDKNISEDDAWKEFGKQVKKDVDIGKGLWIELDRLKKNKASAKELKEAREEAYKHIRLIGGDKTVKDIKTEIENKDNLTNKEKEDLKNEIIDFYKLLEDNKPQEFFKKVIDGVLIAPTVHFYDNHGTPVEGAIDKITNLFEKFGSDKTVRRKVAELNKRAFNNNGLHSDIEGFRDKGIGKLLEGGTKGYLEWRMCKYLEERFKENDLKDIKMTTGENLFQCQKTRLLFSKEFITKSQEAFNQGFDAYKNFLEEQFRYLDPRIKALPDILETFIAESDIKGSYTFNSFESRLMNLIPADKAGKVDEFKQKSEELSRFNNLLFDEEGNEKKLSAEDEKRREQLVDETEELLNGILKDSNLKKETCFYSNELFSVNNTVTYDNTYAYNSILNVVIKKSKLDKEGQYYVEIQPAREKHLGVPDFDEVLEKNLFLHVAGDSKSDICMMAAALERGGAGSIVFSLVQDEDVFKEILKQKKDYIKKDFYEREELFNDSVKAFGKSFYAVEKVGDGEYFKVTGFEKDVNGKYHKDYEKDANGQNIRFTEEQLLGEIREQSRNKLFRFRCPEANARARAEIFGLLSDENIEFNYARFTEAKKLYALDPTGASFNSKQQEILKEYEWAVIAEIQGRLLPQEAPRFEVYREWRGRDDKGDFAVYRSKSTNGQFVVDRFNGSKPEAINCTEELLQNLKKVEVFLNNEGKYVYLNFDKKEIDYEDPIKLKDYQVEHKLFSPPIKGKNIFGKSFIQMLPVLFNGLLKYSGGIMALGGVVRLLSAISGGLQENVYKTGYWLSNGVRAISAVGGALRGVLNVHKAYNITFGEVINMVSSFLPNGIKHMGLGFGNFVLFLGRGQQRALMQQRVNSHTKKELDGKAKENEFVDPRPAVRNATKLSSQLIEDVKKDAKQSGISSLLGELAGNLLSAVVTPVLMIKDVIKDPRLIFGLDKRMSEKSGSFNLSVPSAGHLMTIVGSLSGISAVVAGLFGRVEKFGEVAESGFNKVGSWAIAFANMIPALGIIANAKEIMNNPDGLPRIFRGIDGKDRMYNPLKAGLNQLLAGVGYAIIPIFGLENKYVASLFDIFTGQYFYGASEEELPNTSILGRSILRRNQQLYSDPEAKTNLSTNQITTPRPQGREWAPDNATVNLTMAT